MLKRGAITQQVLIALIILIFVAAVLLLFLRLIPYKAISEKEACHQSAVLRNNFFLKGELGPEVPLRCKTQQIVIKTTDEELIKKEIANAMYDCWWMLGEGKLNFFQRKPTLKDPSYCVICAIISFDENTQKKVPRIEGMTNYLSSTKIPQKNITYWDYITGGEAPLKNITDPVVIETNRKYAIIYSLTEKSTLAGALIGSTGGLALGVATGALAGAAIGTLIFPGLGTLAGLIAGAEAMTAITVTTAVAGGLGGTYLGSQAGDKLQEVIEKNDYFVTFFIMPFDAEAIKNLKCASIESIP